MKALTEINAETLEWRAANPPGLAFELTSGEGVHATLAWSENSTLAKAETPEGTWTFMRVGVLVKHITIREEGSHSNLAEFHPHPFGKGKLEFRDGASFAWTHAHHNPGWAFLDGEGKELLRIQPWPEAPGFIPEKGMILGRVVLENVGGTRWRDALLAALGWYILLLPWHDASDEVAELESAKLSVNA
jgi:hypothetical protein